MMGVTSPHCFCWLGFFLAQCVATACVGPSDSLGDAADAGEQDAWVDAIVCDHLGLQVTPWTEGGLEALRGCEVFPGFVSLDPPISDLSPMSDLRAIEGGITIARNRDLERLEGLEGLERVGGISIADSPIASLAPLKALRHVTRSLTFDRMDNLTDLRGLEGIRAVGKDLDITYNPKLTSLAGLENLERVSGILRLDGNPMLPQSEIDAFRARVEVGQ